MIIQCRFCGLAGTYRLATKIAPQTQEVRDHFGKSHFFWHWLPVCREHAERWYADGQNTGSPPMYELGEGTRAVPVPEPAVRLGYVRCDHPNAYALSGSTMYCPSCGVFNAAEE
jgi:hypothetical protein